MKNVNPYFDFGHLHYLAVEKALKELQYEDWSTTVSADEMPFKLKVSLSSVASFLSETVYSEKKYSKSYFDLIEKLAEIIEGKKPLNVDQEASIQYLDNMIESIARELREDFLDRFNVSSEAHSSELSNMTQYLNYAVNSNVLKYTKIGIEIANSSVALAKKKSKGKKKKRIKEIVKEDAKGAVAGALSGDPAVIAGGAAIQSVIKIIEYT